LKSSSALKLPSFAAGRNAICHNVSTRQHDGGRSASNRFRWQPATHHQGRRVAVSTRNSVLRVVELRLGIDPSRSCWNFVTGTAAVQADYQRLTPDGLAVHNNALLQVAIALPGGGTFSLRCNCARGPRCASLWDHPTRSWAPPPRSGSILETC
jgi:hypothetical protein